MSKSGYGMVEYFIQSNAPEGANTAVTLFSGTQSFFVGGVVATPEGPGRLGERRKRWARSFRGAGGGRGGSCVAATDRRPSLFGNVGSLGGVWRRRGGVEE
eukprot:4041343-Pyramimonas_sp.AAC.1